MDLKIGHTAHELALRFEDESDIPIRFKNGKSKKLLESNLASNVEKRFSHHVQGWIGTIESILNNVSDQNQAWRFILTDPKIIESSLESVTECQDFLDFTDLLIKRRDVDKCSDVELGSLCVLHNAFQKKIEKLINE